MSIASYIEQEVLPKDLINQISFDNLYQLKPGGRDKVLIYDKGEGKHKDKTIFRSYMCFLSTPEFDPNIEKSYMFLNKESELPEILKPFLDFAKKIDSRYNQMVVNWYEPEDYIEFHRDCTAHMVSDSAPILVVNLNETDTIYDSRSLFLKRIESEDLLAIPLPNNTYYILHDNKHLRHAVPKGNTKRISITFRMVREV
jgi:hypothetical protein